MKFNPKQILFSPTLKCNLSCAHCTNPGSSEVLSPKAAKRFITSSRKAGIYRVGFTGGEPFLALDFLCDVAAYAVKEGFLFDKIMTNAVWYRSRKHLRDSLERLFKAGYDGDICVSLDAFHAQDLKKAAGFITAAIELSRRPDIVSIVCVAGKRDARTLGMLRNLVGCLHGKLTGNLRGYEGYIKSPSFFIRIHKIDLSPIGKAGALKDPWDGRWFREDHCEGPGNVFFVTHSGAVKPCCGYANDLPLFTIGNIKRDRPRQILKNFRKNKYLYAIFESGLSNIRKSLEKRGVILPGKTSNHCFFCHYMLTKIPKRILGKCLDR